MRPLSVISLFILMSIFTQPAIAQQYDCQSRWVEQQMQQMLARQYGPRAIDQIQAIGAGRAVRTVVTIGNVQQQDNLGGAYPYYVCHTPATVWREDTGQTVNVSAEFWVVFNRATAETMVQLRGFRP